MSTGTDNGPGRVYYCERNVFSLTDAPDMKRPVFWSHVVLLVLVGLDLGLVGLCSWNTFSSFLFPILFFRFLGIKTCVSMVTAPHLMFHSGVRRPRRAVPGVQSFIGFVS